MSTNLPSLNAVALKGLRVVLRTDMKSSFVVGSPPLALYVEMRKLKISDHLIDFFNKSCRPPRRARPVICGIAMRPTAIAAPAIATAVNTNPRPMTPERPRGPQPRTNLDPNSDGTGKSGAERVHLDE